MRRLGWAYVGPACGILFVVLSLLGLVIHGYPSAGGNEIRHWVATTSPVRFGVGIWIEALGYLLLLPFAVWLARDVRRAGAFEWVADVAVGAAVLCVGSAILVNGIWTGLLDAGRAGVDSSVLVGIDNVANDTFQASNLFYGLFVLAIGVVAVMARSLPPWLAWSALLIGLAGIVPPLALPASLALLIWILAACARAVMALRTT